jgi:hypothetical protein
MHGVRQLSSVNRPLFLAKEAIIVHHVILHGRKAILDPLPQRIPASQRLDSLQKLVAFSPVLCCITKGDVAGQGSIHDLVVSRISYGTALWQQEVNRRQQRFHVLQETTSDIRRTSRVRIRCGFRGLA